MVDCRSILEKYVESVVANSNIRPSGDGYVLYSPFLHFNGQFINVHYVVLNTGEVIVHDNGETLSELTLNGVDVLSNKASQSFELLSSILGKFHFELDGWSIKKASNLECVGVDTLDAINCIKSIFDLLFLHRSNPSNTFKSIVTRFLRTNDIVFRDSYRVKGKAIDHTIDYYLQPRNSVPQVFMNVFTGRRTRFLAEHSSFSYLDLKSAGVEFAWVPIINPDDDWAESSLNIMKTYSTDIVEWGTHESVLSKYR